MEIWTGLILCYLGSLHCAGMCGPLALSLPMGTAKGFRFFWGRLLYNTGRVITYSFLGAVFGLLGSRIIISEHQQFLSILTGASILIITVITFLGERNTFYGKLFSRYATLIKAPLAKLFRSKTNVSLLGIGILNGLLPCGFVYLAIAGSLTTGSISSGMLFMMLFGLGTFPVMLGMSLSGNFLREKIRIPYAKILPALSVFIGIILILRGLNLGIPYLSPELDTTHPNTEIICE